jgi:hypothetical protein
MCWESGVLCAADVPRLRGKACVEQAQSGVWGTMLGRKMLVVPACFKHEGG